jgi:hypothetical protein
MLCDHRHKFFSFNGPEMGQNIDPQTMKHWAMMPARTGNMCGG